MLAAAASTFEAAAQPFCDIDIYNIHDGLPSNYISSIAQTPDGLIWISTWNGLCYHDGYRFVNVSALTRNHPQTATRFIEMQPDASGNLWGITYDRHIVHINCSTLTFTTVTPRDAKKNPAPFTPEHIHATADGPIWILGCKGDPAIRVASAAPLDTTGIALIAPDRTFGASVKSVFTDSKGREWLLTDKGVMAYGTDIRLKGKFTGISEVNGITIFGGADGTIHQYSGNKSRFSRIQTGSLRPRTVNCLTPVGNRHMAIGTDIGTLILDTESSVVSRLDGDAPARRIHADSHGAIWVFTDREGVAYYATHESAAKQMQSHATTYASTASDTPIWSEDAHGTIWLVPPGGVFSYFDPASGSLVPYAVQGTTNIARRLANIQKAFTDRQGNLWAASTHDLALVTFRHSSITRSPLYGQEIRSILPLSDGGFWAGTTEGQLAEFGPDGQLRHYLGSVPTPDGRRRLVTSQTPVAFSDRIYALYRDHEGGIWVGTKSVGLMRIAGGIITSFRHNPADPRSLSCDSVYCIDQDHQGNIWIGTYGGGLNKAVANGDGTFSFLTPKSGLKGYPRKLFGNVRRVTHDKDGTIIVSTTDGLLTFSNAGTPAEYRYYRTRVRENDPRSLHNCNVMQTLVAADGSIYVVSLGNVLQKVTSPTLLADNLQFEDCDIDHLPDGLHIGNHDGGNLLSILEDGSGNLCLVSEVRLYLRMAREGRRNAFGANNFGRHNEFTEAQPVYNHASGRMLIAVVGGVISLDPQSMKPNLSEPPIVFTTVHYRGDNDLIPILNTDRFEAPADKRDMTISFSALDYTAREGVKYAYMMEGADKDWTYLGSNNNVHLSHLKAGNHTLLVRACNGDGVWTETPARITIRCLPTFWETPWAKILYFLLAIGITALAVHTFWLRKRNAMRADMDRMKNKFYTDASHRLRTPLTLIGGPAAELLKDPNLSEESRANVEMLLRNSNNMLAVVNNMLQYARDHSEDVYISDEQIPEFDTLANISSEDTELYHNFFRTPDADTDTESSDVTILIVEDNDDLRRYLANILSSRYKILTAPNGLVGLHMAEEKQPDFILTDVMMPEMDGLTMVHHIKQSKALSHIPIVVLSAKASMADRVQGLSEGIDDYITKPFTAGYLKQRIANIVARRRMLSQTYLEKLNIGSGLPETEEVLPVSAETQVRQTENSPAPAETGSENPAASVTVASGAQEAAIESETATQPDYNLESPQIVDADQEMMQKLLGFIEQRIDDESLKIEELAEAVNLGRTVFYGKIKSLVGMPPSDFLRHLRLKRAEELITKSKMNLSQIAYNVGFSDPKYFTKCFKKEMGMTPSQYRQNARKNL